MDGPGLSDAARRKEERISVVVVVVVGVVLTGEFDAVRHLAVIAAFLVVWRCHVGQHDVRGTLLRRARNTPFDVAGDAQFRTGQRQRMHAQTSAKERARTSTEWGACVACQ